MGNIGFNMNVDIKFNNSYDKKLGLTGKGWNKIIDETIDYGLHEADTIIKREVPRPGHGRGKYYKPTGNLQRSITKNKPEPLVGELRSNASSNNYLYWQAVQYGTGPHTISPKKGKLLKFTNNKGETVFAKKVQHPGMPPNPFVTRTKNKVAPKFKEYFEKSLRKNGLK